MRITVIGIGYVGCVTAACLSRDGHQVIGVDVDAGKVDAINRGLTPVFEPGLEELLKTQVETGRLSATTDLASAIIGSDVALIAVGTPSADDGSTNDQALRRVVQQIGTILSGTDQSLVVVVRSTLMPGVLEDVLTPLLAEAMGERVGDRVLICNNPEFLRETTAIADYDQPPYVLVGADGDRAAKVVLDLYSKLSCEKIVTNTRVSAMIKYTCNAFHALKVGFANEIGTLAKSLGADGREVMEIVCKDTQLNISTAYMRPGFAFGGSCLPKDVRALARHAQREGLKTDLIRSILPSNNSHLERAAHLVRSTGARRIGLVGLSFKAGTDDLRESPQVLLAETLLGQGFELRIFDPDVRVTSLIGANRHYIDERLPHLAKLLCESPSELIEHSEVLIVATSVVDRLDGFDRFTGRIIDLRRDLVVAETCDSDSVQEVAR
ncbi:nucleotide sugar dehydrogenase [Stieleria sp. TO1_6]|uniref:nucleotide sugar dehydrogenase n=1 Tax=Stieleria tagensis TaxID=2956795 RepID=UPI00209A9615|nr:nucleotide sugar dehydrogenase [Stieleria tagensis]MCO8122502.1 nucleotide sugar dehydrogenase [Stieleria tagensis]